MKRLFFLLLLVAAGFYAAWPTFSLYQFSQALQASDEPVISQKVAWGPLRDSLRGPVTERVKKEILSQASRQGLEGMIAGELGQEIVPLAVDQILNAYVTPSGLAKLAANGGKIDIGSLGLGNMLGKLKNTGTGGGTANPGNGNGFLGEVLNKVGEMMNTIPGGKTQLDKVLQNFGTGIVTELARDQASNNQNTNTSKSFQYGLDNIKSFRFTGPAAFEVGFAKSAAATEPDFIAGMGFIDGDWKINKFVPKL